uniref:Uncharacterized protein n=1 Tax=Lepeophtheirus salmonis TaxID=72036 RepID=A0A0K2T515_LEPSM
MFIISQSRPACLFGINIIIIKYPILNTLLLRTYIHTYYITHPPNHTNKQKPPNDLLPLPPQKVKKYFFFFFNKFLMFFFRHFHQLFFCYVF